MLGGASTLINADFYPRPPRGGRPERRTDYSASERISIHALREEGDLRRPALLPLFPISIHALREEGDLGLPAPYCCMSRFLSTPSARRATLCAWL